MSEAQLGCAFQKNVAQIYRFAEPVALSAVVSPQDTSLRSDFEAWLSHFRNSGEYAMLNYLYFEKGIVRQMLGRGLSAAGAEEYPCTTSFSRRCASGRDTTGV